MNLPRLFACLITTTLLLATAGCYTSQESGSPMTLQIIVGSVRQTETGKKIAEHIKKIAGTRKDVAVEIVTLADFNLPFYTEELTPASRTQEITDPVLKKWSDTIKRAQGYIIVAPVYNAGYPGPLKNALDSLYHEWNHKPVAFVGYSGGTSGGSAMIAQLRQVAADGLEMIPVETSITIPQSWKAFTTRGEVNKSDFERDVNTVLQELVAARRATKTK